MNTSITKFVFLILLLATAVLGGILFAFPKYQMLVDVREAVKEREERVQRGEAVLVKLRNLQREAEKRQEDFAKIDTAIPEETALPKIYHELQLLGAQSGLVLSSIASSREKIGEGAAAVEKTTIQLQLQGSYEGVKNFLQQVKSSERMFNAQSVLLDAQDETTGTGALKLQISIAAYALNL